MSKKYEAIDKLSLRFYVNVGVLEPKEKMIDTNREFRDVLIEKGYTVDYEEFGSGHDYLGWRDTLADGLISLIGIK